MSKPWRVEDYARPAESEDPLGAFKLRCLLLGKSGTGKSQSAVTLPGKVLLVDFDGRSNTVAGYENIHVLSILEPEPRLPKAWDAAEALRKKILEQINAGTFSYSSIVWDGMTSLGDYCMNWSLTLDSKRNLGGSPAQQHYSPQMHNFTRFIQSTLSMPVHTLWTGHPVMHDDPDTGRTMWFPNVYGKGPRATLTGWFNECYLTYSNFDSERQRTRYGWYTAGSGKLNFFKSSLNNLGRFWTDPIELDFDKSPQVGFRDILTRRYGAELVDKFYARELEKAKEIAEQTTTTTPAK